MNDQNKSSGWKGFSGQDFDKLPLETQQRIAAKRAQTPAIEIHIKLFDLDKGHSEVALQVDQGGILANALADTTTRTATYNQLMTALERELKDTLSTLLDV